MSIELLTKLTNAVSYVYQQDPCCPSVVFSTLKNGQIYGSIIRYSQKYGGGKQIITHTTCASMSLAIESLCDLFLSKLSAPPRINPIDVLREVRVVKNTATYRSTHQTEYYSDYDAYINKS